MKSRFLFFFMIVLFFTGCEKKYFFDENAPENIKHKDVLDIVNQYRQEGCHCGSEYFPPVHKIGWNNLLEQAAENHSTDMYENNFFSHTGSDGKDGGYRIKAVGYDWHAWGENIAYYYPSAKAVIDAWIESEGHCKNIMNPHVNEMGMALVGEYWTQKFGARK